MNQSVPYGDNATRPNANQYASCTYDTNGNTASDGRGWTYTYNANNQLTAADKNDGQYMRFDYDGLGRLVGRRS